MIAAAPPILTSSKGLLDPPTENVAAIVSTAELRHQALGTSASTTLWVYLVRGTATPPLRFRFLGRFIALRFQSGVLVDRQNSFRLSQEFRAAFFRATRLETLTLPRFDLRLLISCQIETCEVGARRPARDILCA